MNKQQREELKSKIAAAWQAWDAAWNKYSASASPDDGNEQLRLWNEYMDLCRLEREGKRGGVVV